MPKRLKPHQIAEYRQNGYLAPIDIMSEREALDLAACLESAEAQYPGVLEGRGRNNAHLVFKFMDDIAFNSVILDIVEDLLGEDFLLWGTVLFIKERESKGYVSWHQDATYMGLEPHDFVTPWLALSHSNPDSGCMRVIPGSHNNGIQEHVDTFAEDNILTRGQALESLDESSAVDLVLKPGQASFHHACLVHGSKPNRTSDRRIGVALQCYMPSHTRQVIGKGYALHCRGDDNHRNHHYLDRPISDMSSQAIEQRKMANDNWMDILYAGAGKTRDY